MVAATKQTARTTRPDLSVTPTQLAVLWNVYHRRPLSHGIPQDTCGQRAATTRAVDSLDGRELIAPLGLACVLTTWGYVALSRAGREARSA